MIVVADSTPLISLARVGRLDLLQQLYGRVIVPNAVWCELTEDGSGYENAVGISKAGWIERCEVSQLQASTELLKQPLDEEEAEAIALAQEHCADLLLLDERLARAMAERLGLHVTGLIGVLIEAKRQGLEPDASALAEQIRARGVWLSDALVELIRNA